MKTKIKKIIAMNIGSVITLLLVLFSVVVFADDLNHQFFVAAVEGQVEIVKALLAQGADINTKGRYDLTALMLAARNGDTRIVTVLLEGGADVNAKDVTGETALMAAASLENTEIVMALLAKGAEVNARSKAGTTALIEAAHAGDPASVKALLDNGADINAKNNNGQTALDIAILVSKIPVPARPEMQKQMEDVIELLKNAGAQTN